MIGLLELAWQHFALYDEHAKRLQKSFNKPQILILTIGIVDAALPESDTVQSIDPNSILSTLLNYALIILPINIQF